MQVGVAVPDDVDIKFDDVTSYPVTPKTAGLRFRPALAGEAQNVVASMSSAGAPEDSGPSSAQVTQRLDAVRSWQSRGASLTGAIEDFSGTGGSTQRTAARNAAGVPH